MRVQRILPLGQDLDSAALPVGEIQSVQIDNPSGQWLQLFPTYDYIAPYTIGFARTFQTTVQTITVKRNTPAGQVSTQAGDAIKIWLDSEPAPADSNGLPFIQEFTPILVIPFTGLVAATTGLNATILAGVANRRYRLLTISCDELVSSNWGPGTIGPGGVYIGDVGVGIVILDSLTAATVSLATRLERDHTSDHRTFPAGIDFAVGAGIFVGASTDGWADAAINIYISYQVI